MMTHTRQGLIADAPMPMPAVPPPTVRVAPYGSAAAYIRAVLDADEVALRAMAVNVTADNPGVAHETWLSRIARLTSEYRPFISSCPVEPLPEHGTKIYWPILTALPGITVQTLEKTDITTSAPTFGMDMVDILTYAGVHEASEQLGVRSDPNYAEAAMRSYAVAYANATDAGAAGRAFTVVTNSIPVTADTPAAWLDAIAAAVVQIATTASGALADTVAVSPALWGSLAPVAEMLARPFTPWVGPGDPRRLDGPTAHIGGLRFVKVPAFTAAQCLVYHSQFMTTLETPGAPLRLDQLVVSKLARQIGAYGLVAHCIGDPDAAVKLVPPAAQ